MGGNGTIGGGKSLLVDIDIKDKAQKTKGKWYLEDSDVEYPFLMTFDFPAKANVNGKTVTLQVDSKTDKVVIDWKYIGPRS